MEFYSFLNTFIFIEMRCPKNHGNFFFSCILMPYFFSHKAGKSNLQWFSCHRRQLSREGFVLFWQRRQYFCVYFDVLLHNLPLKDHILKIWYLCCHASVRNCSKKTLAKNWFFVTAQHLFQTNYTIFRKFLSMRYS